MNEKKLRLGLVGKDVSKSTSDVMHKFILGKLGYSCEYEKISATPLEFDGVARRLLGDFDGFNITIPYKRDIMEYLEEVVGDAFTFGAVNTVVNATRKGYNTDGMGFTLMIQLAGVSVEGKKILILGGGGAGRSTAAVLKKAGGEVYLYQRNRAHLLETCEQLGLIPATDPEAGGFDVIINASGVGMHNTVGQSPVREKAFCGGEWAIDLIYYPEQSEFLRLAKEAGLKTVNGDPMLFYQAYYADCLFLEKEPKRKEAQELYELYKKKS